MTGANPDINGAIAELLAEWQCHECGEHHAPEEPCYSRGCFAVARLAGEAEAYAAHEQRTPVIRAERIA